MLRKVIYKAQRIRIDCRWNATWIRLYHTHANNLLMSIRVFGVALSAGMRSFLWSDSGPPLPSNFVPRDTFLQDAPPVDNDNNNGTQSQ
jgi:hypothetical protein